MLIDHENFDEKHTKQLIFIQYNNGTMAKILNCVARKLMFKSRNNCFNKCCESF